MTILKLLLVLLMGLQPSVAAALLGPCRGGKCAATTPDRSCCCCARRAHCLQNCFCSRRMRGHKKPVPTPARPDRRQGQMLLALAQAPSCLELRFDTGDEAAPPWSTGASLRRLSPGHNADLALRCCFLT